MQRGIDPSTERGGLNWLSGDSEMRGSSTEHEEHPLRATDLGTRAGRNEVPRKGGNVVSK